MKRLLPIISIILFTAFQSPAQVRSGAVSDAGEPILRFYPNPATTVVNADFQKGFEKGYSIQIYSFLGKKMYEAANINQRITLNLTDYNRGIYIYQLRDKSGKIVESGKFQVSK